MSSKNGRLELLLLRSEGSCNLVRLTYLTFSVSPCLTPPLVSEDQKAAVCNVIDQGPLRIEDSQIQRLQMCELRSFPTTVEMSHLQLEGCLTGFTVLPHCPLSLQFFSYWHCKFFCRSVMFVLCH